MDPSLDVYLVAEPILQNGGVAVLKTDTIYGIVARAEDEVAVEKVYAIKGRQPNKPCIILITDAKQALTQTSQRSLKSVQLKYLLKPTSIIIDDPNAPKWLLREGTSLAYRFITEANPELKRLIEKTGPLIAPSANPEGMPPAPSAKKATEYFGESVDIYIDGGDVAPDTKPSTIIKIKPDETVEVIRS